MFGIPGAEKKRIVGLAVTPNLGLEALVYDKNNETVIKYAQKFLEYNIASREIQDYNSLRSVIDDIFNELQVSKDSANVYITLPNVHFGFRSIEDLSVDDDTIDSMVLSEISKFYLFKQAEPQFVWKDLNAKTGAAAKYIAHSSLQRKVVEEIQDACMDVGINIIGIESSATTIPRGIAMTGLCNDVISNNRNWDILLINPNNYTIFQMSGSRILDYIEVPFAIMSFEGEDVYTALASAVGQYLPNYPAKKLVIVSQTDNVSAKILSGAVVFDEDIVSIDSNKFSEEPCAKIDSDIIAQTASNMSLSALGASCPGFGQFASLNILGDVGYSGLTSYGSLEIGDKEIEINSETIMKFSIFVSAILLVSAVLFCGLFIGISTYFGIRANGLQTKIDGLNTEIEQLNAKLKTGIIPLIKQISENNKTSVKYYDSLSLDIPQNLWLTYYINTDGKDVAIEGFSLEINDIYEYFRNLKILAPQSNIKLNKLEVFREERNNTAENADDVVLTQTGSEPQTFAFEISNTTYTKSFDEKGNRAAADGKNQNGNKSAGTAKAAKINKDTDGIPNIQDVEINLKEIK